MFDALFTFEVDDARFGESPWENPRNCVASIWVTSTDKFVEFTDMHKQHVHGNQK